MLRASATSIKFTSVYPQELVDAEKLPFSFFAEVDGVNILLDCGWDEGFSVSYLEALQPYAARADVVLLSSCDFIACGALPYVVETLKPGAFVYACGSTSKMGIHSCLNTFMYQYPNQAVFTVEGKEFRLDVDAIYSAFRSIKEPFGGKVSYEKNGVEVQCYAAFGGRLLGGYNWTVNCQIDSLFYCPDFSVKPSYILKRVNFPTTISTLFLNTTSLHIQPPLAGVKYEDRLQQLFKTLQQALRSGGDVLVPVDVASRGLEVLSVITHLFKENACDQYKVVLASIQSREIIDKATTMTEVLKNDVMLSEETLFSTVLPCKTAEEVLSIRTPKVCVADGANLDYGIAAELVKPVCQNENSIVLFTSNPKQDTNASNILLNHETMGDFDLRYVRRSRLDREELEEYYRQLEHESELERQRLEMEGAFEVVKEDDDMDLDEDEAGSPKEKKATLVPGLYLPSYVNPPSRKFLNFPLLESNTAAHSNNDDYGLPISEEERNLLKQRAPAQAIIDNLKDLDLVNDAQQDAKIPSKIVTVVETVSLQCKVLSSDLSGLVDAHAFKHIVASKLYVARKIVSIRGSAEDWRSFTNYCRMEKSLKCGDNIFNATAGLSIELATQVFSYVVNLEPQLFTNLSGGQSRVRERNTDDVWEVNWVDGVIRTEEEDGTPIDLKRQRFEAGDLSLATVDAEDTQKCAEYKEKHGFFKGSYFFGEVELPQLRDTSRRTNHLNCEMHKKAPLLVYDDGVCVRKTDTQNGTVLTMSSVTTPNMFTVRQSLYKQFSQII